MKKLMMMTVIAAALATFAEDVPVPNVPVPDAKQGAITEQLEETEAGALCKTYKCPYNFFSHSVEDLEKFLANAVETDQGYDVKTTKFNGESVAKHDYNAVVWEGFLDSPVAGEFTFNIVAVRGNPYIVRFNGKGIKGRDQGSFKVELKKGLNAVYIATGMNQNDFLAIDYRLSSSKQNAKQLTPQNIMHIVEEEVNWEFKVK